MVRLQLLGTKATRIVKQAKDVKRKVYYKVSSFKKLT